ncbi:hypothetical protein H4219_004277 [Mycoemilia scoparia]|uniref:Uncharacterized protein n=1 Tax=Mycoemilia scoparia TaxID=417184 RepID=A0A9W7ZST0_9FUNG|nr:hypothetical protein H4219_004277 [Mycoemilia scoparia]
MSMSEKQHPGHMTSANSKTGSRGKKRKCFVEDKSIMMGILEKVNTNYESNLKKKLDKQNQDKKEQKERDQRIAKNHKAKKEKLDAMKQKMTQKSAKKSTKTDKKSLIPEPKSPKTVKKRKSVTFSM